MNAKLIERGNGFDFERGDLVYEPESGNLYRVVSFPGWGIHTDHPRGNYVIAEVEPAEVDPTDLTQEEWDDLPTVLVDIA